jgi:hypothetical protein
MWRNELLTVEIQKVFHYPGNNSIMTMGSLAEARNWELGLSLRNISSVLATLGYAYHSKFGIL